MYLISRLDELCRDNNVLEHPFYVRWSAGELTRPELTCYAGEYGHAVHALAQVSRAAAQEAPPPRRADLDAHADEEDAHIGLWERFAGSVGCTGARMPLPLSARCVTSWTAGKTLLEHLSVLYVIEGTQPQISTTKLEGLVEHYGYRPDCARHRVLPGARRARRRALPPGPRADRAAVGRDPAGGAARRSGCSPAPRPRCAATGSCSTACEEAVPASALA